MDEYLIVPGTSQRIVDGDVVIIQRLPTTRWVVHHGFYMYNGVQREGWYLAAIPSGTTMPFAESDLYGIVIVDKGYRPRPFPPMPPFPPIPPGPGPGPEPGPDVEPFTKEDKAILDSTMITVADLEARDALSSDKLINGRIVRVNNFEGHVEYFEWDKANLTWKLADLGSRVATVDYVTETFASRDYLDSNFYNKTYIDESIATKAYVEEIYASKQEVAETYTTKEEAAETYASKTEVEENYTTKTEVEETYVSKEEAAETYATTQSVEDVAQSVETLSEEVSTQIEEIQDELEWLELQI